MNPVMVKQNRPGCLIQFLWFVLVGWWLGQIWIALAWVLAATIIGIPLAVVMFNKLPDIIALRGSTSLQVTRYGSHIVVSAVPQYNLLVRSLYYVLIGWWLTGLWVELGYVLCATIIGMPLGFWMFDRVPAVVSLRRG